MNGPLIAARAAQVAGVASLAVVGFAVKNHHPLLVGIALLLAMAATFALFFANLARAGDDPRPHPPGCKCPHERNH